MFCDLDSKVKAYSKFITITQNKTELDLKLIIIYKLTRIHFSIVLHLAIMIKTNQLLNVYNNGI